ncbi:hypothetical protein ACFL27_04310 [candidate division CSSED10-310 bacterium]|uniref:Outer membrane protein beta-barrel domain-containing protein n=1 Tax=candidate division CSSED10-310 bacterium TaxID=2855610 RepID=A0ABV6YT82_UNCC1
MRIRSLITTIFCLSLILLWGIQAEAFGLGYNVPLAVGSADWDNDTYQNEQDYDTEHVGFGLVIDTNLAGDHVFNYRFTLSYQRVNHEKKISFWESGAERSITLEKEFEGYEFGHTFGIGVLRTPIIRFWLGPEIRFARYEIEEQFEDDDNFYGFGIGPTFGLNINPGSLITLSVKTGYMMMSYIGDELNDEELLFLNFGLIFRIRDSFQNPHQH